MATKYIVAREVNVGSSNRRLIPKWLFDAKADADAWARRLGRAAAGAKAMASLEEPWQGADHAEWASSSLASLRELDPEAEPGVRYEVCPVDDFVAPEETPPASAYIAWWRSSRDAP
jgi:hypothetical protein